MDKIICEFCGKEKEDFSFVIGASNEADWCMHEGTGKMSCPECYSLAQQEAQAKMDVYFSRKGSK